MTYTFTNNYNEELAQYIDGLFTQDKADKLPRQTRLQASDSLVEAYVKHTGLRPPGAQLGRLATLILRDELADTDSHKVTREPEPFLSESQKRRRRINETLTDFGEDNSDEEGIEYHSEITRGLAIDGRSYRKPIRRTRSTWELIRMDSERNRKTTL